MGTPQNSRFPHELYEAIIFSGLEGWPNHVLSLSHLTTEYSPKDRRNQAFLARCCLVDREWKAIAEKRLYAGVRCTSEHVRRTLQEVPAQACLVRYLMLDARHPAKFYGLTRTSGNSEPSAAEQLMACSTLLNLEELAVHEYALAPFSFPNDRFQSYPSRNLVQLQYTAGNAVLLAILLSHLPHLRSLHVGRFEYLGFQPDMHILLPVSRRPICKLREVIFQSIYHYSANHMAWLLSSSVDSLVSLTVAHFGSLLNDILPSIYKAKSLGLTVKSNPFEVAEYTEEYQLETILAKFEDLQELKLYVGMDWANPWPDRKHAALTEQFPHLQLHFIKRGSEFLGLRHGQTGR